MVNSLREVKKGSPNSSPSLTAGWLFRFRGQRSIINVPVSSLNKVVRSSTVKFNTVSVKILENYGVRY